MIDNCYVIDSPQELKYCRTVQPWEYNTQVKLNGSYLLPRDVRDGWHLLAHPMWGAAILDGRSFQFTGRFTF